MLGGDEMQSLLKIELYDLPSDYCEESEPAKIFLKHGDVYAKFSFVSCDR